MRTKLADLGITQDHASYPSGSIMRIRMKNFITYDYCTFYPGPFMNMIIGPNGTGKSTIVCAIAIGLGSSASVLGRMKECSAFVKHGQQKGYVEITLKTGSPPFHTTIRRVIKSSGNSSEWFVDGEKVASRRVSELIDSFGIQVDNLCQFLAQDKVSEFSKLDGIQLLQETIKASLPAVHFNQLEELKELKKRFQGLSMQNNNVHNEIESLRQQNNALQAQIDRIREGERKEEQIFLYQLKLLWLRYDLARKEWMEAKEDRERLKELVRQSSVAYQPVEEKLEECRSDLQNYQTKQYNGKFPTIESPSMTQINQIKAKILASIKEKSQLTEQLNSLKNELLDIERQIKHGKKPVEPDWIQPKLMEVSGQLESLQDSKFTLEREKRSIEFSAESSRRKIDSLSRELAKLDDIKGVRLEKLKLKSPDTFAACEWINRSSSYFKGEVHLPICVVVDVSGDGLDYAAEFEAALSYQALTLIVCENDEDFDLLQTELLDKQRLKVNIHLQKSPHSNYTPKVPRRQLSSLGFDGYLIDFVKGPDVIKASLCHLNQLHLVPVAKGPINEDSLFRATKDIIRFCADSLLWSINPDDDGSRIVRTQRIKSPQILGTLYNSEKRDAVLSELNQIRREREGNQQKLAEILSNMQNLAGQEERLQAEKARVTAERKEFLTAMQLFNSLADRKRNLQLRIDSYNSKIRNQNELQSLVTQLKSLVTTSLNPIKDIQQLHSFLAEKNSTCSAVWDVARQSFFHKKASLLDDKLREMKQKNSELTRCLENAETLSEDLKRKARELLDEINAKPVTVGNLTEEQKELLADAADSVEQLETQIISLKSYLEVLQAETDDRIVAEYKARQSKIAALETSLSTGSQSRMALESEMGQKQDAFMSHLQPVVDKICERFGSFFTRIGCVGQVKLSVPEDDARDYERWRLDILVKFREKAPLSILSFARQSGGERSVSTFLYMMALQGLSRAPFRVVDEINQGMDARNEAKMHEIMVDCTTSGTDSMSSQYFLITPKLLSGLKYNERTTVHCVFNGTTIPVQEEDKPVFSLESYV